MENATIKFIDPNKEGEIVINVAYNKDSGDLDYNVQLNNIDPKSQLGFPGFLADIFISALKSKE